MSNGNTFIGFALILVGFVLMLIGARKRGKELSKVLK